MGKSFSAGGAREEAVSVLILNRAVSQCVIGRKNGMMKEVTLLIGLNRKCGLNDTGQTTVAPLLA
jgi:hypothetical protein